jgi:hypothetical protein
MKIFSQRNFIIFSYKFNFNVFFLNLTYKYFIMIFLKIIIEFIEHLS